MEFNLKKILKALLFSTSEPLTIKDIQAVLTRYHQEQERGDDAGEGQDGAEGGSGGDAPGQRVMEDLMAQVPTLLTATQIRDAMDAIGQELLEANDVYRLVQGPNGFKLTTAPEFAEWVRLLRNDPRPMRLSQAAMETLAIIAYRQPVTRPEMEAIRGVSVDSALSKLLEHELIFVSGRADLPGRPIQYSTTEHFLEFIGLRSIEELPASDVLSPAQINEYIRKATDAPLGDADMGLPEEKQEELGLDGAPTGAEAGSPKGSPAAGAGASATERDGKPAE